MKRPLLLLVDNDKVYLDHAREYLAGNGFQILCATTLSRARELAGQTSVAAAVIDYRLVNDDDEQDRSGVRLARELVRLSIPNIITTKYDNYAYAVEALRPEIEGAAAMDFVIKQEGLGKLLEAIEKILLRARVFLCYATPDYDQTAALYHALRNAGFIPWMDKVQLYGGEKWELAIRRAIRRSDFFVVCLSGNSINRRGYMQREIRFALEIWEEKLEEDIYMIPVRLEDCEIRHERLRELQWVDLYEPDGFARLVRALRVGTDRKLRPLKEL